MIDLTTRKAGVLMPVASLPDSHGVGCFGENAYSFIDLLNEGGYKLWQILPLNPLGFGHSPYQPFSSFAIDPIYLDLEALAKEGLIEKVPPFHENSEKILYEEVGPYKDHFARLAFSLDIKKNPKALDAFLKKETWVYNWAVFSMFKKRNSLASWEYWPKDMQEWIKTKPELKKKDLFDFQYEAWLQMKLYEQWNRLHDYANKKGVSIIGDIPFYVGFDSVDVWENQNCFLIDPATHQPTFIAGVPPDYFSATGQRWGNPIYDWDELTRTDFAFLENRILGNAKIYDVIRLDHFRAFDTYWKIPQSCPTAIEGAWIEAPGYAFFDSLLAKKKDLPLIAEDLGNLRPEVLTLRDHYEFPGMNVVEFTFTDAEVLKKTDLDYDRANSVVYLGTHDNDTMRGYFAKMNENEQDSWLNTLAALGFKTGSLNDKMIRYALKKKAVYAVFSLQDLLDLDSKARINVPGVIDDVNWTWRLTSLKPFNDRIVYLSQLNKEYGR